MVCFKFLHPKFSNNTNKHKLKSNLQKLEFSKHLVQIAWGLTIVAAYQNGVSTYDLADKFGCHRSTIASQLRKQGVKVSIEKIDMDDAIRMYELGHTTREIAQKYHMSDNAVSRRLKMAGVKMRTRWDYR